ncbi:MAG: hypothetical protein V7641_1200 [Blastocatellia bacterium]
MHRHGFDRREMRETRQQTAHGPAALTIVADLFVASEGDGAAPVVGILYVINLKTDTRVGAQGFDLAPRQRVNIDAVFVKT